MNQEIILLFYFGAITIFNILALIYKLTHLYNFVDFLTNIGFITFCFTTLYFLYAFIKQLRILSCNDKHTTDDSFMRDTYFKFCFSFQGYSTFIHLHDKLLTRFTVNTTVEGELVGYYSTFILFILMTLAIHFTPHKLLIAKFHRDIVILLGFIAIMFIFSSIMVSIDRFGWNFISLNTGNYMYVVLLSTSTYQFYNWMLSNKLGVHMEPTQYSAL